MHYYSIVYLHFFLENKYEIEKQFITRISKHCTTKNKVQILNKILKGQTIP